MSDKKVESKATEEIKADAEITSTDEAKAEAEPQAKPKNDNPNMNWFVVHAYSNYEKRVMQEIQHYAQVNELAQFFGEVLVPTEEVVELRAGQKRQTERKFFPGYVLVQMELTPETWRMVKSIPRVIGFVGGSDDKPVPISQKEVDTILGRLKAEDGAPRPKTMYEVGEMVRVTDGPFSDFSGVIEEVNYEKSKVLVSVAIFGRATPVELGFNQIDKDDK